MYDPKRDYNKHKEKYLKKIETVLSNGNFINGGEVKELEEKLREYTGSKYCITVGNGTDALQIALMALDIGINDEIITVSYTWISTSEVISLLRATPVFVDIKENTFCIDEEKIEAAITERTKAIMPVSLFGNMPDYDLINKVANKYKLPVIEDAAQSFGSEYKGKKSCNLTTIGCTSFFPTKPLGCYGDGGAIFTNDDDLAIKIRAIKNHGGKKRFHHSYIGVNSRLDTIQAAVLQVKFNNFPKCLKNRIRVAKYYSDKLKDIDGIKIPKIYKNNKSAWAQYSVLVESKEIRDYMVKNLKENGINVAIFYPMVLHNQECFLYLGYKNGDLPVSESVANRILNLPCYAELRDEELKKIINIFIKLYDEISGVQTNNLLQSL